MSRNSHSESQESLLRAYSNFDQEELHSEELKSPGLKPYLRSNLSIFVVGTILSISIIANAFLFIDNKRLQKSGPPKISGLPFDTPVVYQSLTEWWGGANQTREDELWNGMDNSPLAVALTDDWATTRGFPTAKLRFPWDDEKGIYYLKAFHSLHCLKLMRRAWVDKERGNPPLVSSHHVHHCLDALRQDVMCMADDTPMPDLNERDLVGNQQVRMCRDWGKVIEWTQAPERQACYRRLTDYVPVTHQLERFAFCPEDSEYFAVEEAYFERWGHRDPFGE